jgi:hypothetical protein
MTEINELLFNLSKTSDKVLSVDIDFCYKESQCVFKKYIEFYNTMVDEPLHKFWLFLENVKIVSKKESTVTIVISKKYTSFINSVNFIEKSINSVLNREYNDQIKTTPSIRKNKNYPHTMEINTDEETIYFNCNCEKIKRSELDKKCCISMYIELDYVIISSSIDGNKYVKKWRLMQAKEQKKITQDMFSVKEVKQDAILYNSSHPPLPPPLPSMLINAPNLNYKTEKKNNPIIEGDKKPNVPTVDKKNGLSAPTLEQILERLKIMKEKSQNKINGENLDPIKKTINDKNIIDDDKNIINNDSDSQKITNDRIINGELKKKTVKKQNNELKKKPYPKMTEDADHYLSIVEEDMKQSEREKKNFQKILQEIKKKQTHNLDSNSNSPSFCSPRE